MNDFVYIFKFRNGGITLNGAKSKFQTLFQTTIKDKNGNDVNALFDFLRNNNISLLRSLSISAGITTERVLNDYTLLAPEFIIKVTDNTNSTLYSFIKIQPDL